MSRTGRIAVRIAAPAAAALLVPTGSINRALGYTKFGVTFARDLEGAR